MEELRFGMDTEGTDVGSDATTDVMLVGITEGAIDGIPVEIDEAEDGGTPPVDRDSCASSPAYQLPRKLPEGQRTNEKRLRQPSALFRYCERKATPRQRRPFSVSQHTSHLRRTGSPL